MRNGAARICLERCDLYDSILVTVLQSFYKFGGTEITSHVGLTVLEVLGGGDSRKQIPLQAGRRKAVIVPALDPPARFERAIDHGTQEPIIRQPRDDE